MSESHDQELLKRAVAGDEVALTVLMAQAYEPLSAYLARKIPSDLRATVGVEDIAQEAIVEGYRRISTFTWLGDNAFQRWLGTIALRRLRNAIRKRRAAKRGGGASPVTAQQIDINRSVVALLDLMAGPDLTPSRNAAQHEAVQALQQAVELLPDAYRQAVRLIYIDGVSVAEAAADMGRSERAVHNLCYKAKQRLHEIMGSRSRYFGRFD